MRFNRRKFFDGYRKEFRRITQAQVDALEGLLDFLEADDDIEDIRHAAYILATIKHEGADTYLPIEEYGKGRGHTYGKRDAITGQAYYGRGHVQLTWKKNYQKLGKLLGVDLVNKPALALDPEIAWKITSIGMREGLFTGKALDDYISGTRRDYVGARRIINGTDRAALIAGYAEDFEKILNDALPVEREAAATTPVNDIQPHLAESSPIAAPLAESVAEPAIPTETSVTVTDGNVQVSTSEGPKPEEKVAVEKPPAKDFTKEITSDIKKVTGGNLGVQGVREAAEQFKLFGLSSRFWLWISITAVVVGLVYLAMKFYKHRSDVRRDMEITDKLISSNSTDSNKVSLVDAGEIEDFQKRGYRIVRR